MTLLGLLTGMVQAYIFSILAAVYIAAGTRTREPKPAPARANPNRHPHHKHETTSNQRKDTPWIT